MESIFQSGRCPAIDGIRYSLYVMLEVPIVVIKFCFLVNIRFHYATKFMIVSGLGRCYYKVIQEPLRTEKKFAKSCHKSMVDVLAKMRCGCDHRCFFVH